MVKYKWLPAKYACLANYPLKAVFCFDLSNLVRIVRGQKRRHSNTFDYFEKAGEA